MTDWTGKIVVVTGGSAGLGLSIARAFADRSATPVLVARDAERLKRACETVRQDGQNCDSVQSDVTRPEDIQSAIEQVVSRHGRIDVLINSVGISGRTEIFKATPEEYRRFMDVNFLSVVHCTHAAIEHLSRSNGHLVNIGSLACKTAWPFLAPYTVSKFALAGYTNQLRIEGPQNVHYLLVCPGPILRTDSGQRYTQNDSKLPNHAFEPAAGAKVRAIDPQMVAEKIVRGCERRTREIIIPARARILFAINALSPTLGGWLLGRMIRKRGNQNNDR